ncbi:putative phage abortive infection protein [Enterococcus sp. AZ103]|uniref:putative phage abortive infection protein n=1 Tax=Enterococcus sp. AZ103 TaxID=2774628 RepID=UPI003F278C37
MKREWDEIYEFFKSILSILKKYKFRIFLVLFSIILFFVFYPYFVTIVNLIPFGKKVDGRLTNVSRLELLKIFISLIGPILTFLLFRNTIIMQKKNEKKQEDLEFNQRNLEIKQRVAQNKLEKDRIKKEQLLQINEEFYQLLNLFLKVQEDKKVNEAIDWINYTVINGEQGFLNNYDFKEAFTPSAGSAAMPHPQRMRYFDKMGNAFLTIETPIDDEIKTKNKIIKKQFEQVYNITGRYFKIFHRILKVLNAYLDDENSALDYETYKKYIGILRTQVSAGEFLVILFNSLYAVRGNGLGIQLIGSGFFGDENDFVTNQHFTTPTDQSWFLNLTLANATNRLKRIGIVDKFKQQDLSLFEYLTSYSE